MNELKEAAKLLGSIGGSKNSDAQNKARALNGRKGGRPKKKSNLVHKGVDNPERSG